MSGSAGGDRINSALDRLCADRGVGVSVLDVLAERLGCTREEAKEVAMVAAEELVKQVASPGGGRGGEEISAALWAAGLVVGWEIGAADQFRRDVGVRKDGGG